MSARLRISLSLVGLCALPVTSFADGFLIPGLGPQDPYPRPSYRQAEAAYPPPQHDIFGGPAQPTGYEPRPTYRQTNDQFPIAGGRYGGGIVEYFATGGRPEPLPPGYNGAPGYATPIGPVYTGQAPAYAAPAPAYYAAAPRRQALPKSSLPEYAPGSPAYIGPMSSAAPAGYGGYAATAPAYAAYAAPQQQAYAVPVPGAYDPVAADPGLTTRPMNPAYYRQMVDYAGAARPGTIIIDTPNKFLYLVQPNRQAIRYGIGVGRPGFAWSGVKSISRKAEWPDWTPPKEMLARRPDLPRHMEGGEANPLGARALYLGSSLYRIHGTNEPYTIGTNVSSGCIRMMNQDVIDLYGRVGVGTRVVVM